VTEAYGHAVAWLLRLCIFVLIVYGGLIALTGWSFTQVPGGFIPQQDKGYLIVNIQLPDAASLERTVAATKKLEKIAADVPGVAHTVSAPGQSVILGAFSSNFGTMFVTLAPFQDRHGHGLSGDEIAQILRKKFNAQVLDARVSVFGAPPVDGLGSAGGFKLMLQNVGDVPLPVLQGQADELVEKGNQLPAAVGLFNGFRANTPQLFADVDRVKCKKMGLALDDVFATLQIYLGGYYVNDYNQFGRTWQVNLQADQEFRLSPDVVKRLFVRNAAGDMVPLGAVCDVREAPGPVTITRYNMFPAAAINGSARPGATTGEAMAEIKALADRELPASMAVQWTEIAYLQERSAKLGTFKDAMQNPAFAFLGAVLLVFLVLAAQYESWSLPFAVILVVPMCLLCALAGVIIERMDLNIFVQVGFVVLVGLAAKNAILIVAFAKERMAEGVSAFDAAVEACKARLRPIIMTSFAFILGVVPLVLAEGAGAEMRRTLGTAVFSGMLGVTLFGIFLTPVFYFVVMWMIGAHPAPAGGQFDRRAPSGDHGKDDGPILDALPAPRPPAPQEGVYPQNPSHPPGAGPP
jgi:hydrophobe/amphiphile efflux-1 (HAE1) family protein